MIYERLLKLVSIIPILYVLVVLLFGCSKNNDSAKTNIVLIVSDSLRYDALEAHGGTAKTPNINFLIKNGCSFSKAYTTSPRTMPTSVSLLTGNNPDQYPYIEKNEGIRGRYVVPDSEYLFAEYLKENGYETTAYLTNPNSYLSNNTQGFDVISKKELISLKQADNISAITDHIRTYRPYHKIYSFIDYVLNLPSQTNFFSLVWIIDPHVPYSPPDDYIKTIPADKTKLPREFNDYAWAKSYLEYTEYEKKYTQSLYAKEVESMDERVGFIIQALKKKNLLQNTIIVFTADHGEHFGEHGHVGHGNSYFEELQHIPLIIYGPEIPANKTISETVSLKDLTATLNDLLGFRTENKPAGKSFTDLMYNKSFTQEPLHFTGVRPQDKKYIDAIQQKSFKLISLHDNSYQLYDISTDPKEQNNIISSNKDTFMHLQGQMKLMRDTNNKSKTINEVKILDNTTQSSSDEKETLKRLKSLGYMR